MSAAAMVPSPLDRPRKRHPSAEVAWAYTDAYGRAVRTGYSQADARDYAEQEAARVRRERSAR